MGLISFHGGELCVFFFVVCNAVVLSHLGTGWSFLMSWGGKVMGSGVWLCGWLHLIAPSIFVVSRLRGEVVQLVPVYPLQACMMLYIPINSNSNINSFLKHAGHKTNFLILEPTPSINIYCPSNIFFGNRFPFSAINIQEASQVKPSPCRIFIVTYAAPCASLDPISTPAPLSGDAAPSTHAKRKGNVPTYILELPWAWGSPT